MENVTIETSIKVANLWDIPGGIHPPQQKSQSTHLAIGEIPLPPQLIIPLNQHMGAPAKPVVKVGDKVLAGQLIAEADGIFSANIHASSSGVISDLGSYPIAHPSGMSAQAIVITTDGKHEFFATTECRDYLAEDRVTLLRKIRAAGVAGLGGAGFPTDVKLNVKSTHRIDTLIINGAECEPYITADDLLMQEYAQDIIAGTFLLSHILHHPERLVIAVEDNKPKALEALQQAQKNYSGKQSTQDVKIEIISIPTKYPSGGAKQLTQIITGREIPHGHHSADVGVICVNVATAAAAWRAVAFGEALISRITTLTGDALAEQRNLKLLIGTPISLALAHQGFDALKAARIIMGGSLMGFTLSNLNAPVSKTTNCIIAATAQELPPPPPAQACIRCGLCSEVCPASLLPQQLFWYAQAEDYERIEAHHLFDCIECGACSYVCPSKIPLVQYYRAAKGNIRQQLADKQKAERSRQRFEFRQERFAREEAAKEAKRIARKKAADEARQKLAEQKAKATSTDNNPVVEAVVKAQAHSLTAEEQKARLERLLATAQNSLASAREPLVPRNPEIPITDEQRVKQQARIKQAELKVAQAQKQLADFFAQAEQTPAQNAMPALARAQAKIEQSPQEKLRANLTLLNTKLTGAQQKADEALAAQNPIAAALQKGADNIRIKIAQVQTELDQLTPEKNNNAQFALSSASQAEQAATDRAIAQATEKMNALALMSQEEKLAQARQTLQLRLQKARARLAAARAEGSDQIAILEIAVTRLEEKLNENIEQQ